MSREHTEQNSSPFPHLEALCHTESLTTYQSIAALFKPRETLTSTEIKEITDFISLYREVSEQLSKVENNNTYQDTYDQITTGANQLNPGNAKEYTRPGTSHRQELQNLTRRLNALNQKLPKTISKATITEKEGFLTRLIHSITSWFYSLFNSNNKTPGDSSPKQSTVSTTTPRRTTSSLSTEEHTITQQESVSKTPRTLPEIDPNKTLNYLAELVNKLSEDSSVQGILVTAAMLKTQLSSNPNQNSKNLMLLENQLELALNQLSQKLNRAETKQEFEGIKQNMEKLIPVLSTETSQTKHRSNIKNILAQKKPIFNESHPSPKPNNRLA